MRNKSNNIIGLALLVTLTGCVSDLERYQENPINFNILKSQPCILGENCAQNIDGVEINYQIQKNSQIADDFIVTGSVDFHAPGFAHALRSGSFPVLLLDASNKVICQRRLFFNGLLIVDSKFKINSDINCQTTPNSNVIIKKSFIPSYQMTVSDGYQADDYRANAK